MSDNENNSFPPSEHESLLTEVSNITLVGYDIVKVSLPNQEDTATFLKKIKKARNASIVAGGLTAVFALNAAGGFFQVMDFITEYPEIKKGFQDSSDMLNALFNNIVKPALWGIGSAISGLTAYHYDRKKKELYQDVRDLAHINQNKKILTLLEKMNPT